MEAQKPSTFRIENPQTNGADLTRIKFVATDIARYACRAENGACGFSYTSVDENALEIYCERKHCGFDPDRFVKKLAIDLDALANTDGDPDNHEPNQISLIIKGAL